MADKILTELVINRGTKQKFDDLPTKSPDELYFITDTETFQRKLTAGANITIEGDTISATSSADGESIKNQNADSPFEKTYDWTGTLQEAIDQDVRALHPDWKIYITDDISGGDSVYTKTEADEKFIATDKITNCITEIPQDIKLELNNGTLTLKAGSKVYVPNGAGNFDVINITSDKTRVGGTANKQTMFFWDVFANGIRSRSLNSMTSGSSAPTVFTDSPTWYDTINNKIKFYNTDGTIASEQGCFPLCLCTANSGGTISSIDQVFNGFGYIGSTVFALPGVKGLIPNGRNEDGSLKNIETIVNSVSVHSLFNEASYLGWFASDGYVYGWGVNEYVESENEPNVATDNIRWFDTRNNRQLRSFGGRWIAEEQLYLGMLIKTNASGNIESFKPKNVFRALDNGDTAYIGHQAMPNYTRRISVTAGASGAVYTAPADGYYHCLAHSTAVGGEVVFTVDDMNTGVPAGSNFNRNMAYKASMYMTTFIPVKKGQVVHLVYASVEIRQFQFIYAQGSK